MASTSTHSGRLAVTIRPAKLADAAAFANLGTQLGYPSSPQQVAERLSVVLHNPKHLILAALVRGQVAGWAHAYVCCLVESDLFAEVGGLVVDASHRGKGVGGKLLAKVEDWARKKGCRAVMLRSNVVRQEAHKFYANRGYGLVKTQYTFRKLL